MNRWLALLVAAVAGFRAAWACAELPAPPVPAYDWCSDVVVRPDQRFHPGGCDPIWSPESIARGAGVVMMGDYDDVSDARFAHTDSQCTGPSTHADNARYVAKLRAPRPGSRALRVVHMSRFDLVADSIAALPGFRAEFLAVTDRPWNEVLGFFAADRSPLCGAEGCRWSDAFGGWEDRGKGSWLRDRIDAAGGDRRHESAVYYVVRGGQAQRIFWPVAAIADLRNPAYRAFRVAEAKRALAQGGYDAINLNQKFFQYRERHWIGTAQVPDAAALRARNDDSLFTGPPRGYRLDEYVQGWIALAADLRAAGVPYSVVEMPEWPQLMGPGNANRKQAKALRDVMEGAEIVLLQRKGPRAADGLEAFGAELAAAGVDVRWVDLNCGLETP